MGKIDAAAAAAAAPGSAKSSDGRIDGGKGDAEGEEEDDAEKKKKGKGAGVDRDMPILPQLRSKFDSSQSYGLDKIDFSLFSSAYEFAETVAFLFLGFAPYV